MIAMRRWSVRHARGLETFYNLFERAFVACHPLWKLIGYERLDAPMAAVEKVVKGFLFDCQMCGQCALSSTGMSCSMNCPKNLRNGPCGGVRPDGHCEVKPEMPCVWVLGFQGSERMRGGYARIRLVQPPVDRRLQGRSAWLAVARERAAASNPPAPAAKSSVQP
jgi:hypothetical protein